MKIGLLVLHVAYNYGSMLQAFATQRILSDLGHKTQIIDYYPIHLEKRNNNKEISFLPKKIIWHLILKLNPKHRRRIKRFKEFRKQFELTKRYCTKEEIYKNPPKFDLYIVGSDQVWNMQNGIDPFCFMDFVKDKSKKISFSSSFGTSKIQEQYKEKLKVLLQDFSAISTREDDGVRIIKEATGRTATQVLDPTLLLPKESWKNFMPKNDVSTKGCILIYALNNSLESAELIEAIKKRYNLPVIGIPMGAGIPKKFSINREIMDSGPFEFISHFYNCKIVVTSSFHGLAFAINFEKTFFVVPHPTRNSRLNSLLKALKLDNRQKYNPEMVTKLPDSELYMDFSESKKELNALRLDSIEYLRKNI